MFPKPLFLLWFCIPYLLTLAIGSPIEVTEDTSIDAKPIKPSNGVNDSLRLTIGSVLNSLNTSCNVDDECILKNSFCSPLTKRCECNMQTMENNSLCQVIYCSSSLECQQRYPNTFCNYGHCQCQLGLKANGQCVSANIPGINSSTGNENFSEIISKLPPWSFPAILLGAVFSGVLGSRSSIFSQIFQHLFAIIVLVARAMKRTGAADVSLPTKVVAEIVEDFVEIPLTSRSASAKQPTTTTNAKRALGSTGVVENCHHVHEVQLHCDSSSENV